MMAEDSTARPDWPEVFDNQTIQRLEDRWFNARGAEPGFWRNVVDFWHNSLVEDFKVDADALTGLTHDYEALYKKIYFFNKLARGSLLPIHTLLFVEKIGFNQLFLAVLDDNIVLLEARLADKEYTHDECKELSILAALFGSQRVFEMLSAEHAFEIDTEVLNMAIVSGQYAGDGLAYFTNACQPTYNAIRYAIRSENVDVLRALLDEHHLQASPEHLTVAASTSDGKMFELLIDKGLVPTGQFVLQAAEHSENQAVIDKLVQDFDYRASSHSNNA
ncbi:MAG: hypothetical protein K0U37_09005 [Gammaproteobacteria bacterium]|nr:hypothetical protein [Gammaproteobacteria bacterium]